MAPDPMPWMGMAREIPPAVFNPALALPKPAGTRTTEDRKSRRRATHNMVERRRRDAISDNIRQLDSLMPNDFDLLTSSVATSPMDRHSKSNVLKRGVSYVQFLHAEQAKTAKRVKELEQRVAQLEDLLEGGYS